MDVHKTIWETLTIDKEETGANAMDENENQLKINKLHSTSQEFLYPFGSFLLHSFRFLVSP